MKSRKLSSTRSYKHIKHIQKRRQRRKKKQMTIKRRKRRKKKQMTIMLKATNYLLKKNSDRIHQMLRSVRNWRL